MAEDPEAVEAVRKRNVAFLNQPRHGREACIAWDVQGDVSGWGGFIAITDCSKRVSLDLDVSDEDGYENSLYKVDRLLKELHACRTALVDERARRMDAEAKKESA